MGDLQKGTCTTKEPVDLFDSRSLLEDERRGTEQLLREGYRFPEQEKWSNTTCTDCGNHVYKPTGVSRRFELPTRSRKKQCTHGTQQNPADTCRTSARDWGEGKVLSGNYLTRQQRRGIRTKNNRKEE